MYEHVILKKSGCHPVYMAHPFIGQNSNPFIPWNNITMSQIDLLVHELVSLRTFIIPTPIPHTGHYTKFHFWNVTSLV